MTEPLLIGSLFSGTGGLDHGVAQALAAYGIPTEVAWYCDIEPGPSKLLAHHWPGVPNLHDITTVDWNAVPRVRIITGGSPCQDLSHAGKGAGMRPGTRSGLWASMCDAIQVQRPDLVVWENVRGALSAAADSNVEPCPICVGDDGDVHLRALGRVLGDLAELGYDASWVGVRASDAGAPHARFRVFVAAWPAADPDRDERAGERHERAGRAAPAWGGAAAAVAEDDGRQRGGGARDGRTGSADGGLAAADADGVGRQGRRPGGPGEEHPAAALPAAADALGGGLQRRRGPEAVGGAPAEGEGDRGERERDGDAPGGRRAAPADAHGHERSGERDERAGRVAAAGGGRELQPLAWGAYASAIARWERVTGRPAPAPTEFGRTGKPRLSPRFVEWLMGLPDGHVTAVPGLTRNEQLKLLGNGVVPQQAALALHATGVAERLAEALR